MTTDMIVADGKFAGVSFSDLDRGDLHEIAETRVAERNTRRLARWLLKGIASRRLAEQEEERG